MAKENYDCHGWATQYGVLCGDGRTIMHGAFADQDGATVPLIWNTTMMIRQMYWAMRYWKQDRKACMLTANLTILGMVGLLKSW